MEPNPPPKGRAERLALVDRLAAEDAEDLAARLRECGEDVPLVCTNCGSPGMARVHCRARYCPECRPLVTAERVARWKLAIARMRWPLFLTLTIPNSEDPESLRRIRDAWGKFRRRKLIRECIAGGVATFEITNTGNGWHPHLHAIADCEWLALHVRKPHPRDTPEALRQKFDLARAELSALWADQLGEPTAIVLAKRLPADAPRAYVLKYAVKASELLECPAPIAPMLRVLKRTRTLSGWGNLHPLPSPDEDPGPGCQCPECNAIGTTVPAAVAAAWARPEIATDNRSTAAGRW